MTTILKEIYKYGLLINSTIHFFQVSYYICCQTNISSGNLANMIELDGLLQKISTKMNWDIDRGFGYCYTASLPNLA